MRRVAWHACHQPNALALLAPGRPVLTYHELLREVDGTAKSLAASGFGRGDRIAVALPNGPELAIVLIALTDCATCAPLNPLADEATCRYLLRSMRIDALIAVAGTDTPAVRAATDLGLALLQLAFSSADPAGTFALTTEGARQTVTPRAATPDTVSLLLHTSGTTARPKLVPLTCGSLSDSASGRASLLRLARSDRALCVAPMYTSSGIKRILLPTLWAGASVVCTPGFAADSFLGWIEEFQPTFYAGNPTIHRAVLDLLDRRGTPAHSLRFAISTSAPMPEAMHARFEATLGIPLLQAYAMTEIGAIAQSPLPPVERRAGSVGLAAGCEIAVMDATWTRCRPGEIGEIVVRGPEVFAGYEGDAEATAAAFRDGWFRTGDLGYLDGDGYLYLSGRAKDLINRGGFKVSPAEVDAALLGHPAVLDAATFSLAHPTLGEDVAAAVVLRAPGSVTVQQLRDFLLERLTAFKVPSRVMEVESIPRTALGKVRRRELAEAFAGALRPPYVAPHGRYEILVAGIFAEVLGLVRVGAQDNFFELGGDSLRGVQVVGRVNAFLARDLSPVSLFRRPSVREYAQELVAAAAAEPQSGPPAIAPRRHGFLDAKRMSRR